MPIVSVWHITEDTNVSIRLKDQSSLDAITRQLPEGYYSTFRTFAGCTRVLGLTSHLKRLYEPVATSEINEAFLRKQLYTLLGPFRPNEARVRAVMTGDGQVYLAMAPLSPLPREIYEGGVRAETTELQREQPRLKSTSFISKSDWERQHMAHEGVFEALLVKNGKILEGMTSNFFYAKYRHASSALVTENAPRSAQREVILCTARDDILLGITRETVIELARWRGLKVKEQPLGRHQLAVIDEAFITSSSRGIVPVVRIDNITIGQGNPGPITRQLIDAYEEYVVQKAEKI